MLAGTRRDTIHAAPGWEPIPYHPKQKQAKRREVNDKASRTRRARERQRVGSVPTFQDFDPSQDLFDAQFGDGGVGDGEMPGTSAYCGGVCVEPKWEFDYDKNELEEGELMEPEGGEGAWWKAPHDVHWGG
ncbi:hypothetical protein NDU88_005432 [Pleurodeles waltl]|uniref:Uncharacterized protein n=1 Tax=Pleurodeles waltl TaxID=8319 RepID=A0AAV7TCI7_PLEWA|nr:hypothetical protein NDU88_005432 [Pleurodeles waltl]